ncbi:MAG: hypothetical protein M1814_000501 [Vezdaea aestivalis]|nr:MAG: hypothetical protein M1814_000501 [Vezdaea aestivalis]
MLFSALLPALAVVPLLASSNEIDERAACNANNCLRALRRRGFEAASSCSTAYGVEAIKTITETVTNFKYTTGTVYTIVRNPFTIPAFPPEDARRDVRLGPRFAPRGPVDAQITPAPRAQPRDAAAASVAVPPYASACSGTSGFASACSCLTVETTLTREINVYKFTSYTTTGVCNYKSNYGYLYTSQKFGIKGEQIAVSTMKASTNQPGPCCKACFDTADCLSSEFNFDKGCTLFINQKLSDDQNSPYYCPVGGRISAIFSLGTSPGPILYNPGPCGIPV